jgi:hypothetical protein
MGQWIVECAASIPFDADFLELPRRLSCLNASMDRIRGDQRVTLSAVGFRNENPFMMLISNFLNFDGPTPDNGPGLKTYLRRPNHPEVRAVGTMRPDVFERVRLERMLQASTSRRLVPRLIRQAIANVNTNVAQRSQGSISTSCVSGYLLRSGLAEIGGHGIPDNAACFPGWVRRDLEREGIVGFEPLTHEKQNDFPIQWKGMSARRLKGTIVRIHEIANAGKPIFDGKRPAPHVPTHHLRYVAQHAALMKRDRLDKSPGVQSQMFVLRADANEICALAFTGSAVPATHRQ